ncbi:MAG: hypothetical protein LBG70_02020 [Bifidobacteriaceae bacterium]|nr:hypothetical protein [Bifidobacteriaceae bacterium]
MSTAELPSVVHVRYAWAEDVTDLAWLCSQAEQERAGSLEDPVSQVLSLVTAALLREATAMLTGIPPASADIGHWCRICRQVGDHGRPVAFDPAGMTIPQVFLSASRTGQTAVVAASAGAPIGLAVASGRARIQLDTSILTPVEIAALSQVDPIDQPESWQRTALRKLAIGKATGYGDQITPRSLDVLGGVLRSWPGPLEEEVAGGVQLVDVPELPGGLLGSVAYLGARRPLVVCAPSSLVTT